MGKAFVWDDDSFGGRCNDPWDGSRKLRRPAGCLEVPN
jgi:hypothetical protein